MRDLVVALAQNASFLLAMVVVFDFLTARERALDTRVRQLLAGLSVGVIGVAMMGLAVTYHAGIIFDTRSVLLAVSGLFLGFVPTAVGVAMTAAFRMAIGGGAAVTGVAVILMSGAIGTAWHYLRRNRPLETVSWRELYALGLVVHALMMPLMFLMPWETAARIVREVGLPVMVVHPLATLLVGLLFVQRLRSHKAVADLESSESRFRLLAENAIDVIFRFDFLPEPRFTYMSPSSTGLTGYTPEEYYAEPDLGRRIVHPDDRDLLDASRRGEVSADRNLTFRWIRKDGSIIWTEQRNRYVRNDRNEIIAIESIVRDITSARLADAMIRTALRVTNQGLFDYDVASGELRVSDEYARMLGYEPAGFNETYATWLDRLHPDDAPGAAAAMTNYLSGRTTEYHTESRLRTRSGEWRWVLSLASLVSRDAGGNPLRMVGTHTDITALKSAEQRALAVERDLRRLTQILEASQAAAHVGGWEYDVVRETLFWTDETYRIHDVTPAEYSPSLDTAIRFFTAASAAILEDVLKGAIEEGVSRGVELELISGAGRRKWVFFCSTVTIEPGATARVTCAIQDITARKEAERERLDLTGQLYQAQKLDSLGSLAGGVAHDINNVLAAILTSAETHRRTLPEGDPVARALDTIASACVRGRSVVRSLLHFARTTIETSGLVDLNAVVRDIVELLEKTTLKRIRFDIQLPPGLPSIEGDEAALSHAVMNLCVNAVDAMPGGGVLSIRTFAAGDGTVSIRVRDDGTGMTPEVAARAVEPFFTTKAVGKGTGLGLSMVYGTVRSHGGTLDIVSAPGQGTEICLTFAAALSSDQHQETHAQQKEESRAASLRVLLVDDDELIRSGLSALLETCGHEVRTADGGSAGLACVEEGFDPDVVVLDVNMPGMSGPEMLELLLAKRPGQPVLMSSGFGDEEMARAASGRPNVLTIRKPFTFEELEAKLAAACGGSPHHQSVGR